MKPDSLFVSKREKRLWLYVSVVCTAIYGTLFLGRPLTNQLRDQNVQAAFFLTGMLLIALSIGIYAVRKKSRTIEIAIWLGLLGVFVMFIFRLGAPERSHVIEYSVLAVFLYRALSERAKFRKMFLPVAILSTLLASLIGVIDETIQIFLPNRVFDPQDILFNFTATVLAVAVITLLQWIRKRFEKSRNP